MSIEVSKIFLPAVEKRSKLVRSSRISRMQYCMRRLQSMQWYQKGSFDRHSTLGLIPHSYTDFLERLQTMGDFIFR